MPDEFRKGASIYFVFLWYLITNKKQLLTAGIISIMSGKSHIPLSSLFSLPPTLGKSRIAALQLVG